MSRIKSVLTLGHKLSLANAFIKAHVDKLQLYAFIGRTDKWENTYKISNITQSSPVVVTSYFHDIQNGDIITITDVLGMININDALVPYVAQNVTENTVELRAVDSSAMPAYTSGGLIRKSNENNWPEPKNDLITSTDTQEQIIATKKITVAHMSTVIPRHNWKLGEGYDFWDPFDSALSLKKFFVVTDEYKVYKCLWNSGGAASTVKPTTTTLTPFNSTDGYTWKYMYTIPLALQDRFMSVNWIPVRTLESDDGTDQWDVQNGGISGTINSISVAAKGINYVYGQTTVTIEGDGQNAAASIPPDGIDGTGKITKININNPGQNYNYANIKITGPGFGVVAHAVIAPGDGHGTDPVKELLGYYVKIATEFNSDEQTNFMIDNDYRQIGLIEDPKDINNKLATKLAYDCRHKIGINPIQGVFLQDDIVKGVQSEARGIITNQENGFVYLSGIKGTFVEGESIVTSSGAQAAILSIVKPEYNIRSGSLVYIANFGRITRTIQQSEDFSIVIEF